MSLFIVLFLVNFLRTIIIIAIIYYGIRLFTRYVLPLLVDKGIKNMQQKMQEQHRHKQHSTRPDGEVTIERNKRNSGDSQQNKGEYVDFEEVD